MHDWNSIGVRVRKTNAQGQGKTDCPKCERKLALSINIHTGKYHCHGCLWEGGLAKPLQAEYKKPKPIPQEASLKPIALDWLKARGLSEEVISKHGLFSTTYSFQEDGVGEVTCQCLGYPISKHSQLVNIAWRRFAFSESLPAKREHQLRFVFTKDCEQPLLNTDNIKWDEPIYWVEGWLDGLALETTGITNWLSFPNGSPKPGDSCEGRLNLLNEFYCKLEKCPQHVLALDNDPPGKWMIQNLARRLGEEKCQLLNWQPLHLSYPDLKFKDVGDVLKLLGKDELQGFLRNYAYAYPLSGTATLDDLLLAVCDIDGIKKDSATGITEVDNIFTLQLGYLTIWTGIPNIGKSTMVSDFVRRIVERQGWKAGIFSAEDTLVSFGVRLASQVYGSNFKELSREEKVAACRWIDDNYTFIKSEEVNDLDEILLLAAGLVRQRGLKLLVLDPWNKISYKNPNNLGGVDLLNEKLNKCSAFAKKYNVAVVVVAHPPVVKTDKGTTREIRSYYEINGGAQWGNIADAIVVTNPPPPNYQPSLGWTFLRARFGVLKMRQRPELGEIDQVDLAFDTVSKRYYSMDDFYRITRGLVIEQEEGDI